MTRGWPLTPRDGTIAAVVVGSFPWGSGGIFTRSVCKPTNAVVSVNSVGENRRGANDGWRSNAVETAEASTAINNPKEM
jgi:hypothetical protein